MQSAYPKNLYVQICKPFWTLFPCSNWCFFFIFCWGELQKQPKCHILLILTGKNASKWLDWHTFRIWGMLNPMLQVSNLCNKQFLKITISGKNFTFCWFWLGKMHWNCLSGTYLMFEACQIQWHLLWVSMISGSWKITTLGDIEHKMGLKIEMGCDICSSTLWVPFYPYTMFQNPISRPSSKKCRKP